MGLSVLAGCTVALLSQVSSKFHQHCKFAIRVISKILLPPSKDTSICIALPASKEPLGSLRSAYQNADVSLEHWTVLLAHLGWKTSLAACEDYLLLVAGVGQED